MTTKNHFYFSFRKNGWMNFEFSNLFDIFGIKNRYNYIKFGQISVKWYQIFFNFLLYLYAFNFFYFFSTQVSMNGKVNLSKITVLCNSKSIHRVRPRRHKSITKPQCCGNEENNHRHRHPSQHPLKGPIQIQQNWPNIFFTQSLAVFPTKSFWTSKIGFIGRLFHTREFQVQGR